MRQHREPRIEFVSHTPVVRLRDTILPIADLSALLGLADGESDLRRNGSLVVMQVDGHLFGILADRTLDTEEIVVKPMASALRHISGGRLGDPHP